MNKVLDRTELAEMVKAGMVHAKAHTIAKAPSVLKLAAKRYYDPEVFDAEMARIFRRVPLLLAVTAEMRNPGDYKTLVAAGVPVLLTRGQDGEIRAFVNSCSHRGTAVATEPHGNARRFVCPYHGWTFTPKGELMGIASAEDFGTIDKSCYGLIPLRVTERAGLIWGILDPKSTLSFDAFLAGYDKLLAHFEFEDWHFHDSRILAGPNWKIAYDGYLDFYHLPVLHKNTFGENMDNQANYYAWGPHQRVQSPSRDLDVFEQTPESEWPVAAMLNGVWTIFPHVSIASFQGGGRAVMLSQLLPGEHVGESFTTQMYLMEHKPDAEQAVEADAQFKFLEHVVRDEDYATGLRQQVALKNGGRDHVLFGENEGGAQRFHQWVDRLLATEDDQLEALFAAG
jgi:phenylpropionate dioxygenase-like ring-hydroxylating dioxygenase large terminal subunit